MDGGRQVLKPKTEAGTAFGLRGYLPGAVKSGAGAATHRLPSEVGPMFPIGVPLLVFAFAIYNLVVFLMPGFSWTNEIWHVYMISGGEWGITPSDAIVAGSVVILLIDMLKSARRTGRRTILDNVLSMVLFVGMLIEFMTVKA